MRKKLMIGAAVVLLAALLLWLLWPEPKEVDSASVTQGRFERAVQEDGKTRLRERYLVSTPLAGRVARLELKQGDSVLRDARIATLWPSAPVLLNERERAEQVARIGAMQAAVSRTQANVARASAALEQARAQVRRSETLVQQGFVSPQQHETERLNRHLRDKELDSARQDAAAAGYDLAQSRVALQQFAAPGANQRAFEIKAPISGQVLSVLQPSEGHISAGTPLLALGDPSQLEVVAEILTEEAAQITPGTAVQLSNWGGPDVLSGQVRLVESAAFTKVSALGVEEQRVNVIIDITSPQQQWRRLGDGFKVDVRVLVQVQDNVIKVPVSALFPLGTRSALFVLHQGQAQQREVEVVARNGVEAWLKSGPAVGSQVIIYPDTQLQNGDRVKVRATNQRQAT